MIVRPFRPHFLPCGLLILIVFAVFATPWASAQTTFAAETGNNTAACAVAGSPAYCEAGFAGMNDAASGMYNAPPGNVSNVDVHELFYPGNSTLIAAHLQGWFCMGGVSLVTGNKSTLCDSHIQVGYTSYDSRTVDGQINDIGRRGIDAIVLDWYGTKISPNPHEKTAQAIRANLDLRCHTDVNCPLLVLMEDEGAFKWTDCPKDGGGKDQTNCLIGALERDLLYMDGNYFGHDSYLRVDPYGVRSLTGRPIVLFFICEECWTNPTPNWTTVWNTVRGYADSTLTHSPYFIFQNSGGFTHAKTNGSFAWVNWSSSGDSYGLAYLDDFYDTAVGFYDTTTGLPKLLPQGASWKGFDETNAPWVSSGPRIMGQQCGRTWLQTFQQLAHNNDYLGSRSLPFFGIVTWNDYEEGTEVETGIDNCLRMSASISGSVLSWTPTFSSGGSEATVHHYIVFDSLDGQNLTAVATPTIGTRSLDLNTVMLAQGTHILYVKAVGQPSILNHISNAVTYPIGAPGEVVLSTLTVDPAMVTGGTASQGTVTLSAAASTGTIVGLVSSNPAAVSVPESITIQSGKSSQTFTIATAEVQTATQVTISASYAGVTKTAMLTVNPAQTAGSQFSIVVLPDVQNYNNDPYPNTFSAITDWIVANRTSWNIQAVMGEGDITNYANEPAYLNPTAYWWNARDAVKTLDAANIPYVLALGNHDYDDMYPASTRYVDAYLNNFLRDTDTDSPLSKRYPTHKCPGDGCWFIEDYPAGTYRNLRADVTINSKRYMLLALELYPPTDVLNWAENVIASNSAAQVMITTHAFIFPDDNTRVDTCNGDPNNWGLDPSNSNDAEAMWHAILRKYSNVSLVVNGHFSSGTTIYANHRQDLGLNGNLVNQMIADYQDFPNGGDGYIRILTFDESANTIHVKTYSPTLNQFRDEGKSQSVTAGNSQFDVKWHTEEPGGTATFKGFVRRASDCSTVSGATVSASASGSTFTTSSAGDGSFTLNLPASAGSPNLYNVQVSGTGIVTASDQANAFTGFPAYLKFHVSTATVPTGNITGTVTSNTGKILRGATVRISSGSSSVTVTTGTYGSYDSGQIAVGTYSVTASKGGYLTSAPRSATVTSGNVTAGIDFILQRK